MANKPYAIFTVIVGNYDTVKQPTIVDDRFIELTTIGTTDEKVLKERFSYVKDFLISIE